MVEHSPDIYDWIRDLQASDQPEIDKLSTFFERITAQIAGFAEQEIELSQAMQDHESLIKQQVKLETIKHARKIFAEGYQIVTGRKAWNEERGC